MTETPIGAKAAYVRAQAQDRRHTCHWPGCTVQVPPAMWGCKAHWYKLPAALRDRIWRTFRPGQEKTQTPSREYVEAARAVQAWIAAQAPGADLFSQRKDDARQDEPEAACALCSEVHPLDVLESGLCPACLNLVEDGDWDVAPE